jgi:hypothetical protein
LLYVLSYCCMLRVWDLDIFLYWLLNSTGIWYLLKTRWVWVRVSVFTCRYRHGYEILLMGYVLAARYLFYLTRCHTYLLMAAWVFLILCTSYPVVNKNRGLGSGISSRSTALLPLWLETNGLLLIIRLDHRCLSRPPCNGIRLHPPSCPQIWLADVQGSSRQRERSYSRRPPRTQCPHRCSVQSTAVRAHSPWPNSST